ncbi:MAG: LptF/LptG family permease, partial [Hyphomicrobiales bacterium]|nr:LptF/LptG family permease [Hyphomicrobiales bacterium]
MPAIPVLGRIGRRLLGALAIQALAAFAALTAILWLVGALSRIDLVTDRGQTLLTFLAITALALPALAVVLAPIAVFLASIFLLWKLAGDSEIAAMAAAGGSPRRLATPFLAFAALVALAGGYVANSVAPAAARVTTTMLAQVGADFLSRVLAPGAFSSFEDGLTLHFRARAADGSLVGVFIDDARDPARRMTYVAKAGRTTKSA